MVVFPFFVLEPLCAHFFNTLDIHVSISFFYFFLILLHSLMSHLLKTSLEVDHTFRMWSIYLVKMHERHVLRTSSIEVAHICGVYIICLILGAG
jgi:hypothetical protein